MSLEITTPSLGKTKKSAKDLIISTLTFNYPLTLSKLTNNIKKKYGASVTFQGVRKAVNLLIEQGIVEKKGKEFLLNKNWIRDLRDFSDELYDSYFSENPGIKDIETITEDMKIYTFDNLIEVDLFWNKIITKWFSTHPEIKERVYVQQFAHMWPVLGQMQEEASITNVIHKYNLKFYILNNGNTKLDKWCKNYYEGLGAFYTTNPKGKKEENDKYYSIYGDFIIQTTYPKEIANQIDEIYESSTNFENFKAHELIKILKRKIEIKVMVMKNSLIAEQLRKGILAHFV